MHLKALGCLLNPLHILVFHLHTALLLQGLLLVQLLFGYPSALLVALLHQQILDRFQVSG